MPEKKITILALLALLLWWMLRKKPGSKEQVTSKLCDALGNNCQDTGFSGGTTAGAGAGMVELPYVPFPVKTFPDTLVTLNPSVARADIVQTQPGPTAMTAVMAPRDYIAGRSGLSDGSILTGDAYYMTGTPV